MDRETINVRMFRYDPSTEKERYYRDYVIPFETGMSAMNALDYIYQHVDASIAYYDHAGCALGICARCTAKVNGKPGLLCQTPVEGDMVIEPLSEPRVIRDLVIRRGE